MRDRILRTPVWVRWVVIGFVLGAVFRLHTGDVQSILANAVFVGIVGGVLGWFLARRNPPPRV